MHDGTIIVHLGADILDRLAGFDPGAVERFAHAVEVELSARCPGRRFDVFAAPALSRSETLDGWKHVVSPVVVDVLLDPLLYGWDEQLCRALRVSDRVLRQAGIPL